MTATFRLIAFLLFGLGAGQAAWHVAAITFGNSADNIGV